MGWWGVFIEISTLLDTAGKAVVHYEYDAWGNQAVIDGNNDPVTEGIGILNPFRYRGYYYDTETGLYYLKTRYYDPEIGRFISQDSIEYADPETINGLNLYAYCLNNPVMNIDPTGQSITVAIVLGILGAGAIAGAIFGGVKGNKDGDTGWKLVGDIALGTIAGLAVGGGVVMLGSMFSALVGAASIEIAWQAFSLGAVAFDLFGVIAGAILGLNMDIIEPGNNTPDMPSLPPYITGSSYELQPSNIHKIESYATKSNINISKSKKTLVQTILYSFQNLKYYR